MNNRFQTKRFDAAPIKDNEVEGLASTYGNIDHAGDIVERGAYTRTLGVFNQKQRMPFLAHHRHDRPIGSIVELKDTDEGLWFKARFSDSHDGQNVRSQFLDGTLDSFSIGYRVIKKEADRVDGQRVLRLKEIALHEISAVTFPCNELAKLSAVKGDIASSFPNLSLEDQQRVADFAAYLDAKQAGVSTDELLDEVVDEAVKSMEADIDTALSDAWMAYRIKKTFNR
ncbi:HK97 family phage prohead protease [Sphingobium lactosutens]|uniref:HK97 family phage prohead protease n=1 Tax=Sphingobium lactosutens TaxID=522773 RepID=UPI0015BAA24C|nr:HK97 family phage prohead protease [Sphingobium lactosutens]NWK96700.1 HK97 family phage prohead protease [Sphingobium lactosutens]